MPSVSWPLYSPGGRDPDGSKRRRSRGKRYLGPIFRKQGTLHSTLFAKNNFKGLLSTKSGGLKHRTLRPPAASRAQSFPGATVSDRRSNECEGALHLQRAVLPGEAQRDVPQGLAHDGAEPPRSRADQLVFGCGAASAVREETLYQEVNVTELWSFQGRLRLSSHPEEASWARYHFGSELAAVSMLNYSLAMDTGLALGSRGWGIWRDGKGCSENPPNPDLGEGRKGQRSQGHLIRLCRRWEVGRGAPRTVRQAACNTPTPVAGESREGDCS